MVYPPRTIATSLRCETGHQGSRFLRVRYPVCTLFWFWCPGLIPPFPKKNAYGSLSDDTQKFTNGCYLCTDQRSVLVLEIYIPLVWVSSLSLNPVPKECYSLNDSSPSLSKLVGFLPVQKEKKTEALIPCFSHHHERKNTCKQAKEYQQVISKKSAHT